MLKTNHQKNAKTKWHKNANFEKGNKKKRKEYHFDSLFCFYFCFSQCHVSFAKLGTLQNSDRTWGIWWFSAWKNRWTPSWLALPVHKLFAGTAYSHLWPSVTLWFPEDWQTLIWGFGRPRSFPSSNIHNEHLPSESVHGKTRFLTSWMISESHAPQTLTRHTVSKTYIKK